MIGGALMRPSSNIVTNISASPGFSILANLIQAAGLIDTYTRNGPVTVFAPDNKAFEKLPTGQIDTLLLSAHKGELIKLLNYHVISGKLTAKDIERQIKAGNGQAILTTLSGNTLTARINENRNIVLTDENGRQSVVSLLDIQQSNGILHIISMVLMPKFTQGLQATYKP